jgi:aspartate carbamoyltransferase catalytic subunit
VLFTVKFEIQTEILIYFSFFESKPKTALSYESGESKIEADTVLMSTEEEEKDRPATDSSLKSGNR